MVGEAVKRMLPEEVDHEVSKTRCATIRTNQSQQNLRQGLGTNLRDIALSGELLQLITMSLV